MTDEELMKRYFNDPHNPELVAQVERMGEEAEATAAIAEVTGIPHAPAPSTTTPRNPD